MNFDDDTVLENNLLFCGYVFIDTLQNVESTVDVALLLI